MTSVKSQLTPWLCCIVVTLGALLTLSIVLLVVELRMGSEMSALGKALARQQQSSSVHSDSELFREWSIFATNISGADHTPLATGETGRGFGAHLGPLRSTRCFAIVIT